jgi:hypothetical protein
MKITIYGWRTRADLSEAKLGGATLFGADLRGAKLRNTHLRGAIADTATRWPRGFDPKSAGVNVVEPGD